MQQAIIRASIARNGSVSVSGSYYNHNGNSIPYPPTQWGNILAVRSACETMRNNGCEFQLVIESKA